MVITYEVVEWPSSAVHNMVTDVVPVAFSVIALDGEPLTAARPLMVSFALASLVVAVTVTVLVLGLTTVV